jgi:hypothetical protein
MACGPAGSFRAAPGKVSRLVERRSLRHVISSSEGGMARLREISPHHVGASEPRRWKDGCRDGVGTGGPGAPLAVDGPALASPRRTSPCWTSARGRQRRFRSTARHPHRSRFRRGERTKRRHPLVAARLIADATRSRPTWGRTPPVARMPATAMTAVQMRTSEARRGAWSTGPPKWRAERR